MCFGVSVSSLATRKVGFINLSALIVERNIQDKTVGIFIGDLKKIIGA